MSNIEMLSELIECKNDFQRQDLFRKYSQQLLDKGLRWAYDMGHAAFLFSIGNGGQLKEYVKLDPNTIAYRVRKNQGWKDPIWDWMDFSSDSEWPATGLTDNGKSKVERYRSNFLRKILNSESGRLWQEGFFKGLGKLTANSIWWVIGVLCGYFLYFITHHLITNVQS